MGGFGSGRYTRDSAKTTVEECRALDTRRLHRDGSLNGTVFTVTWRSRSADAGRLSFRSEPDACLLIVKRPAGDELLNLEWSECHYGGSGRPWFTCAGCSTRRAVLYDTGKRFRCRGCLKLTYRAQQENVGDRLLLKGKRLTRRLGGDGRGFTMPPKPKGMHWSTYERISDHAAACICSALAAWQREAGQILGALDKRIK